MKRRNLYLVLAFILIFAAYLGNYKFPFVENSKAGDFSLEKHDSWNEAISANINTNPIILLVDGKEVKKRGQSLYMTDNMQLMVPSDLFRKAFNCVTNIYDNQRLILERNTIKIELEIGKDWMTIGDSTILLSSPLTIIGNNFYIPLEAAEKGLHYSTIWSVEENKVTVVYEDEDYGYLPYQYDYRTMGRSPAVQNQGSLGTCWAFASLTALESSLLSRERYVFARDHMSIRNSFGLTQNAGGEYTMSMAYLTAWQGPVLGEDDLYGDGISPDHLSAVKHVQEIQILPSKDYEKIKEAVYLYGGVQSSFYTSLKNNKSKSIYYNEGTYSYCYIGTDKPNHDIVIVGWDDNYSKENFNLNLEGDGAFLCINSWGEEFGDKGYFYISYYDTNIGIHNILYSKIERNDNYSNIYQSDLCGWVGQLGYGLETAYFANVYEAKGLERLDAVGFYTTGQNSEYEVLLARNVTNGSSLSSNEVVAKGKISNVGYYTISLNEGIALEAGERFGIIVSIKTPGAQQPIAIEYPANGSKANVDLSDGEGYISVYGTRWERVEETQNCNICLKAYTVNLND